MSNEQAVKEAYCIKNGWTKSHGYRVSNIGGLQDDYDYVFVGMDDVHETDYWTDENNETAYDNDDIEDLIEQIDDWKNEGEQTFEDFKQEMKT